MWFSRSLSLPEFLRKHIQCHLWFFQRVLALSPPLDMLCSHISDFNFNRLRNNHKSRLQMFAHQAFWFTSAFLQPLFSTPSWHLVNVNVIPHNISHPCVLFCLFVFFRQNAQSFRERTGAFRKIPIVKNHTDLGNITIDPDKRNCWV